MECLLERAKYKPNMHPIHNKESFQTNMGNKDKPHKARRRKKRKNVQGATTTATFPAALMWRRQANNVTLANATHRKIRWMSDGTGTQVRVQMVNKCKVLINLRRLYKRRKSP